MYTSMYTSYLETQTPPSKHKSFPFQETKLAKVSVRVSITVSRVYLGRQAEVLTQEG